MKRKRALGGRLAYAGILAITYLSAIIGTSLAQVSDPGVPVTDTISNSEVIVEPSLDTEVEVLRAQLETMRQYDQRLLETVYWALGTAVGIALFLVTYGAISTFVLSEREKRNIASELENEVTKRFIAERESANNQIQEAIVQIQKQMVEQVKQSTAQLAARIDSTWSRLESIEYDSNQLQAEWWISKEIYSTALRHLTTMLDITLRGRKDLLTSLVLDEILRVIGLAQKDDSADLIDTIDKAALVEQLDKLSPQYAPTVQVIRRKLEEITK